MIKELVEFSKKLDDNGIYKTIQNEMRNIKKPIFVIPVKEDLEDFDIEKSYFVFKDKEEIIEKKGDSIKRKYFLTLDSMNNEKKFEINSANIYNDIKTYENEEEEWRVILRNLPIYTKKPSSDSKGNKSIGSTSGTISYNLFIFELKEDAILSDKKPYRKKLNITYNNNLDNGIMANSDDEKEMWHHFFEKFTNDNIYRIMKDKIEQLSNSCWKNGNSVFSKYLIVIKLPKKYYINYQSNNSNIENIYQEWYEQYLKKKIFKTEEKKGYPKGNCSICGSSNCEVWLPDAFHNLDSNKEFIKHTGRIRDHNIAVCRICSLYLYKFQEFFLNKLRISIFPLLIGEKESNETISILNRDTSKANFRDIVQQVYRKLSNDIIDYYLIIYNSDRSFIAFDYVTGFQFYKNGVSVFQLEDLINITFFDRKLLKNYFNKNVDTGKMEGSKDLNLLIYKYRKQVFDYIYRAGYQSLDSKMINDMMMSTLKRKLRDFFNPDITTNLVVRSIKGVFENYYKINKYFEGDFMTTVERIKASAIVNDHDSFAFYAGQIVYYLLSLSEKTEKSHAMVEPFINIANLKVFSMKLNELFNAYKHAVYFSNQNFNKLFSSLWAFIYDHKDEKYDERHKILFYAGYFDNENIIYKTINKVQNKGDENEE